MKILIDIIQDRKKFIENDLCTFMYDIYSDIYKLRYSTSYRKREIVTIACKTDTKHFHRKKIQHSRHYEQRYLRDCYCNNKENQTNTY